MGQLIKVASKNDIAEGKGISVEVQGKTIALVNAGGKIYAIDNECTHAGGPLCEGEISGTTLTCPWHGAQFDLTSGQATAAPAFDSVKCYQVVIEGSDIKIQI